MEIRSQKNLEEAKAHFYAWRMPEAYALLRRFYDRLPFRAEPEHAEYVGVFIRVLAELGKLDELKFYVGELEKLYARTRDPMVGYPLGVVYSWLSEPRPEAARAIFEEIVRNPEARAYHAKAKMMLADYFLDRDDIAACRALIDSIGPQQDVSTSRLVAIWDAVVLRRERKPGEAAEKLATLVESFDVEEDWYAWFSASVVLALALVDLERREDASAIYEGLKAVFEKRNFRSLQVQLAHLERQLRRKDNYGKLTLIEDGNGTEVRYSDKSLRLKAESPGDLLMRLFARRSIVDKADIVKTLYRRQYQSLRDDKLIYYHIHALRKRLRSMGLPEDVITHAPEGYRLTPELDYARELPSESQSRPLDREG